jgi:hypothetical protein
MSPITLTLIGLCGTAVGGGLAIFALYTLRLMWREKSWAARASSWLEAQAVIRETGVSSVRHGNHSKGQYFSAWVRYDYAVDGQAYQSYRERFGPHGGRSEFRSLEDALAARPQGHRVGASITVRYMPEDPQIATCLLASNGLGAGWSILWLFVALGGLAVALIGIVDLIWFAANGPTPDSSFWAVVAGAALVLIAASFLLPLCDDIDAPIERLPILKRWLAYPYAGRAPGRRKAKDESDPRGGRQIS